MPGMRCFAIARCVVNAAADMSLNCGRFSTPDIAFSGVSLGIVTWCHGSGDDISGLENYKNWFTIVTQCQCWEHVPKEMLEERGFGWGRELRSCPTVPKPW